MARARLSLSARLAWRQMHHCPHLFLAQMSRGDNVLGNAWIVASTAPSKLVADDVTVPGLSRDTPLMASAEVDLGVKRVRTTPTTCDASAWAIHYASHSTFAVAMFGRHCFKSFVAYVRVVVQ